MSTRIRIEKVKKSHVCGECGAIVKRGERMFVVTNDRGLPLPIDELCMKCGVECGNEWRATLEGMDL